MYIISEYRPQYMTIHNKQTSMEEAAPPPTPILYTGPPTFTMFMPTEATSLWTCFEDSDPIPALNMIGLIHSRLSTTVALSPPPPPPPPPLLFPPMFSPNERANPHSIWSSGRGGVVVKWARSSVKWARRRGQLEGSVVKLEERYS